MERRVGDVIMAETSSTLAPRNDDGNSTSMVNFNPLFPMMKGSGETTTSEIFTGEVAGPLFGFATACWEKAKPIVRHKPKICSVFRESLNKRGIWFPICKNVNSIGQVMVNESRGMTEWSNPWETMSFGGQRRISQNGETSNQVTDPLFLGAEHFLLIVPKISPSHQSNPRIVEYFFAFGISS